MKKLLIIGLVWPEPATTAAGVRMMQLINIFKTFEYQIYFVSTAERSAKSFPLENLNVITSSIVLNSSSFDSYLLDINPSIVLFDRFITEEQFGWRVAENCPSAIKILDTEDLHFLRDFREKTFKENNLPFESILESDLTKREIGSIYRCDFSLIISKYEYNLLLKTFKISADQLFYLPFLIDKTSSATLKMYPSFTERNNFVFVGNFKHKPNASALIYLKSEIWPLIKSQLPKAEMHFYGAYASEKITQLHNLNDQFIYKGWEPDLSKIFLPYKVCLAPLQFGAGLKGKLVSAMQYGTPTLTTNIGAEGIGNVKNWPGFIENDALNFANKSALLYTNQNIWENSQIKGIKLLNSKFNNALFSKKLFEFLSKLFVDLKAHRATNFVGNMLNYHLLQGTKYMSKWIEEKNKNLKI
jgi:glycosyltransferase involved in cell wall biosynthesis